MFDLFFRHDALWIFIDLHQVKLNIQFEPIKYTCLLISYIHSAIYLNWYMHVEIHINLLFRRISNVTFVTFLYMERFWGHNSTFIINNFSFNFLYSFSILINYLWNFLLYSSTMDYFSCTLGSSILYFLHFTNKILLYSFVHMLSSMRFLHDL